MCSCSSTRPQAGPPRPPSRRSASRSSERKSSSRQTVRHTHDPLIIYPSRYTPPYDASALHITLPMCMRTPTLSGLLRVPNPPHRRTTHTLSFSPPSPVRRGRSHRQVRPVRGGARGCDGPLVPRKGRGRGPRVDDEDDRQQRGPGLGRGVHAGI